MAWIELHQTLPTNKKTLKFKRLLKIETPQAVGHLVMLWLWALDNAEDGQLSDFSVDDIAEVCKWKKDPKEFFNALVKSGFVDASGRIHDWDEYTDRLISRREVKREKDRERQQRYRERLKEQKERNADVTRDVTRDIQCDITQPSRVSHTPIPNSTVQYPTEPYQTKENNSGGGDGACAESEDFDISVEEAINNASGYQGLQDMLMNLSPDTQSRFYRASGSLYALWGINPTEKEHLLLFWIVQYMHAGKQITMDDGYIELLTELFMTASKAGKESVSYLFGIARRLRQRGISTINQYWDYQAKRDLKKA